MATIQTLSSQVIDRKKVNTLEAQNLRKVVHFRDINIIDAETIEYNGSRIAVTKSAFKNLLGLLGMSQAFAQKFETLFTKEAKSQFINTMKNAMSSNSGKLSEVTLVLNPLTKYVVAITKKDQFGISNSQFMGVAENIIDNNGMSVSNWSVDPGTGIVTINAFNPNANFAVKGLSDEVFTGGVTFQNSPKDGFQVLPYVNRQWCTNGMTTAFAQESYTLNSLDQGSMEKFFENLNELRKNNFAPTGFAERVRAAHNTPASLHELQFAHNLISPFAGERSDNWLPLAENMNAFYKAGFDTLSTDQLKHAKSNTSVWDVVNGVTHFATHAAGIIDTNMQDYNASDLMVKSGNLFGKKSFDHENTMPDIFGGRELVRTGSLLN
jgi:hypothetical protein